MSGPCQASTSLIWEESTENVRSGPAKYIRWGFYFKGLHKILYLEMESGPCSDSAPLQLETQLVSSVEFRNGMWTAHPDPSSPPCL